MAPPPQHKMAPIRRFIKVILDFNIQIKKLRLSLKFAKLYNNELADIAKIFVSDGRVWEMEIKRDGENIWLDSGFDGFARHYSIKHGHLLQFKYKSLSNFAVRIFDMSGTEIPYASGSLPNPIIKRRKIPKKGPKKEHVACDYWSESGILSPRHFKSTRPYFEVELQSYNCNHNVMYVPGEFAKKHMKEAQAETIKLEVCDGGQWNVRLLRNKEGRLRLGKGWNEFCKENNLKERDVCIFELAKENNLKVFIFVAL